MREYMIGFLLALFLTLGISLLRNIVRNKQKNDISYLLMHFIFSILCLIIFINGIDYFRDHPNTQYGAIMGLYIAYVLTDIRLFIMQNNK